MTYDAAVSYLYNLQKHGIKLGLETMTALIAGLGGRIPAIASCTSPVRMGKGRRLR